MATNNDQRLKTALSFVAKLGFSRWTDCLLAAQFRRYRIVYIFFSILFNVKVYLGTAK